MFHLKYNTRMLRDENGKCTMEWGRRGNWLGREGKGKERRKNRLFGQASGIRSLF